MASPEAVEPSGMAGCGGVHELFAPKGWKKKLVTKKGGNQKRKDVVYFTPDGEEIKTKRQLDRYLKAHPGGPPSSDFDWTTGETPRRSARLSSKTRLSSDSTEAEPAIKRSKHEEEEEEEDDDEEEEEAKEVRTPDNSVRGRKGSRRKVVTPTAAVLVKNDVTEAGKDEIMQEADKGGEEVEHAEEEVTPSSNEEKVVKETDVTKSTDENAQVETVLDEGSAEVVMEAAPEVEAVASATGEELATNVEEALADPVKEILCPDKDSQLNSAEPIPSVETVAEPEVVADAVVVEEVKVVETVVETVIETVVETVVSVTEVVSVVKSVEHETHEPAVEVADKPVQELDMGMQDTKKDEDHENIAPKEVADDLTKDIINSMEVDTPLAEGILKEDMLSKPKEYVEAQGIHALVEEPVPSLTAADRVGVST